MPSPALRDGEVVMWNRAANREQGGRAVGGRLRLTTHRLIFTANRLDRRTRGRDWQTLRENLAGADVAGRTLANGPFSGGSRRRLEITLADGSQELFVVWRPDHDAAALARLLDG